MTTPKKTKAGLRSSIGPYRTRSITWARTLRAVRLWHIGAFLLAWMSLFVAVSFTTESRQVFLYANPVLISLSLAVLVAFSNGVLDAWRNRNETLTSGHLLTIGIVIGWITILIRQIGWYLVGLPIDAIDIALWSGSAWLLASAALFHITAVEAVDMAWPPRYFIIAGFVLAVVVGVLLIFGI